MLIFINNFMCFLLCFLFLIHIHVYVCVCVFCMYVCVCAHVFVLLSIIKCFSFLIVLFSYKAEIVAKPLTTKEQTLSLAPIKFKIIAEVEMHSTHCFKV